MGQLLGLIEPHLPPGPRKLVMQSFNVARRNRCLEPPPKANQKALASLGGHWKQLSGDKRQTVNPLKYALGAGAGLLGGLLLGYGARTAYPDLPVMVVVLLGMVIGAGVAHFATGNLGWKYCMMKLIVSERRSPVRKAMVTDQADIWVPKALMLHRQKEWRIDRDGVTYMLLRLPYRARLARWVHNIIDCLALPADLHVMLDSAGKGQRVWNRRLAKNGTAYGHLDDGEEEPKTLEHLMPHLIGAGLIIAGIVIVAVAAP